MVAGCTMRIDSWQIASKMYLPCILWDEPFSMFRDWFVFLSQFWFVAARGEDRSQHGVLRHCIAGFAPGRCAKQCPECEKLSWDVSLRQSWTSGENVTAESLLLEMSACRTGFNQEGHFGLAVCNADPPSIRGDVVARLHMTGTSEPGHVNAQFGPVAGAQEKGQCLNVTCIVYAMLMDVRFDDDKDKFVVWNADVWGAELWVLSD